MSYADIDDVFKRYKPIRSLVGAGSLQVSSDDVASIFIADAEGIVDGFLGRRYEVPLTNTPSIVTQIASDLAIFNMLVEKLPDTPDFFQPRYDRAMSLLKMYAKGEMIIQSADVLSSGDQEAWSSTQDYHGVFSPVLDDIKQAVDSDRIDSEKDDRSGDAGYDADDC